MLTINDLQRQVPAAFADSPHSKVSDGYNFIPTHEIIQGLIDRGLQPVDAQQVKSRDGEGVNTAKHLIRFDIPTHVTIDGQKPQLLLINSHNRMSSYNFMLGVFRFVCSNGLIVSSANLGSQRVRHYGQDNTFGRVIDAAFEVVDNAPKALGQIERMQDINLNLAQRLAYAKRGLEIRWNQNKTNDYPLTPEQVLTPARREDEATDLWTTYNVVQENLIRGGQVGRSTTGRPRLIRAVKSFDLDTRINRGLWEVAEEASNDPECLKLVA